MDITETATTGSLADTPEPATSASETQPNPEDVADTYSVNVNGQVEEVTLEQLTNGFMRQADYTRKTTEVANLKAESEQGILLMDALTRNPQEAVQAMVDHYGLNMGTAQAQTNEGYDYQHEEGQVQVNPEIEELRQEIRNLSQQNAQSALDKESEFLAKEYGASVEDIAAAKKHAILNGYPNIESAFQNLHFADAWDSKTREGERRATDAQVLEEKRAATGVVGAQTSVSARGSDTGNSTTELLSVHDAMTETLRELNLTPKDLIALD